MHDQMPPILTFGETRAAVGKQMKKFFGPSSVDEVVPISNQDAEAEFGINYKQQAQWNMVRSESVDNSTSMLTGDNPFLKEKMNMKKADMGDVIDDFYTSDAPQFQGKSKAKRRQMAIAAKLSADEEVNEEFNIDAATISEGVNSKVLKTFKDMIKSGEEDNVKLLLQGMPKHTKTMYMKRLGIKESEKVDGRTKSFKETINRLNMAKVKSTKEEDDLEEKSGLKSKTLQSYMSKASDASMHRDLPTKKVDNRYSGVAKASKELDRRNVEEDKTMIGIAKALKGSSKGHAKQAKQIMKHVKDMDKVEEDITKMPHSHLKFFATKKIPHGRYTHAEIEDEHKRRQKVEPNYHSVKPSINELSINTMRNYVNKSLDQGKDKVKSGGQQPRNKGITMAANKIIDKKNKAGE